MNAFANQTAVSRRALFSGAAAAAVSTAAVAGIALADEPDQALAPNGLPTNYNVKLLIIGGGLAGYVAGIHALESGLAPDDVLMIDKLSGEGGDFAGSSYIAGGSYLAPVSDSEEDVEAYAQAVYNKGLQHGDLGLIRALARGSFAGLQWLKDHGGEYGEAHSVFPKNPEVLTSSASMPQLMGALREDYEALGGVTLWSTKAQSLNVDAGGVCGAVVRGPEGFYNIAAAKTLLCTGGYAGNKQFLEDHLGESASTLINRARGSVTGDGIYMAQEVGGVTVGSAGLRTVHLSAVHPDNVSQGQPGNQIPYCLAINSEGKRFMDEALGSVRHGQALFNQPVTQDGLISDSKQLEGIQEALDKFEKWGLPTYKTDTLEEMAEIFGVDPATLVATVEEFNTAVQDDGTTVGLEVNKTAKAATIDTPPYYGIWPLIPGTSLTYGGLAVDEQAHVLQADGEIVPNLFALGEGTGGFFYDDYFGGTCICRCAVFGQVAVDVAMEELGA